MTAAVAGRRADIQALRALAIVLVVVSHLGLPFLSGGYIGVDVFFVISGFLITGHLLRELADTGRIRLGAFAARRARRILPPALLVAAVTLAAGLAFLPPLSWPSLGQLALAVALFVPNMVLAATGTDYLQNAAPSPFQHYWSLGVEEQFYLVWPLVLFALFAVTRRSPRRILVAVSLLTVTSFAGSVLLLDLSQPWAFFSLPSRAWEFGVGALVALVVRQGWGRGLLNRTPGVRAVGVWLGVAVIVATAFVFSDDTRFPGVAALAPVLGTAFVILAGAGQAAVGRTQRTLARAPLAFVGGISYSLYLWHWPLLVIPQAAVGLGVPLPLPVRLGLVVLAVVLAYLTQRFVEGPVARLRAPRRARVVVGSVAGIAVLAVSAAVLPERLLERAPLSAEREAAATIVTVPPVFTGFVPSNLQPALDEATSSTSVAHRNGCHIPDKRGVAVNSCAFGDVDATTTVALFGDSHAAHWLPALTTWAESHGVRVESYTKVGCASVAVPMSDHGRDYSACTEWRAGVIDRLESDPPALVVLANTNTLEFVADGHSREEQWATGIRSLIGDLPAETGVLALANTPELDDDAPVCLSNHLDDAARCSTPRDEAVDVAWIASERAVFESAGAEYADLNDYFCTTEVCGPIVGDTLLYRDVSHLTEVWSTQLAGVLGAEVDRALGSSASRT